MTSLLRPRSIPRQTRALSPQSLEILRDLDDTLHDPDQSAALSYKELRTRLNTIPRAERGADWTESVVKLYCGKRMKAQRCNTLRNALGEIRQEAGQGAHHRAFCDELARLTAPYVLTLHGYTLPFRNRDQTEIVAELSKLVALLDTLGVESFINSGTLLGAVREGAFLGHDDDADLAIVVAGQTDSERMAAFVAMAQRLNAAGALSEPALLSKSMPVIKIELKSGVKVDLFPCWTEDDRIFIWPHTFGELQHADVFPLDAAVLNDAAFPAPKDAGKMLALNYGAGWRSPDAHFQFPWGEAKKKFQKVLRHYRHQRRSGLRAWLARIFD